MDFRQLEYIVAIAENKSISKAAETLFITQSGLNQQLIKLEKELGLPLFDRNKHFLRPTKAGEIYVKNAIEILKIKRNTYTELGDLKKEATGEISLGLTHEHGIDLFTSVFTAFNQRYPGITFALTEAIVARQNELLLSGQLDLGLVMLLESARINLEYITLFEEDLILGIPKNHPEAARANPFGMPLATTDLRRFHDSKFSLIFSSSTMRQLVDPLFQQAGYKPQILIETAMNHALIQLVSKGFCCTILPYSRMLNSPYSADCAWFKLQGRPRWQVCFARQKDTSLSEAHRYLIRLAKRYGQNLQDRFI